MDSTPSLNHQSLIVEDDGLAATDIQARLSRPGYPMPVIAHSGEAALHCARSTSFDLVLMDIRLKGQLDGVRTAQALKQIRLAPLVYLTAFSDPENSTGPSKPSRSATW